MDSIHEKLIKEGLLDDPEEVMTKMENPRVLLRAEMNMTMDAYDNIPSGNGIDVLGKNLQKDDWVLYVPPTKVIKNTGNVPLHLGKVHNVAMMVTVQTKMGRVSVPANRCIKIDIQDVLKFKK